MVSNEPKHIDGLLKIIEKCAKEIEENSTYPSDKMNDILISNNIIRASSNYYRIKDQYEKIYTTFESKLRKEDD